MKMQVGERVLITTNNWFYGPDGKEYRAVFGTVKSINSDDETLGIKTNRNATNWYVEIGDMIIAGCQIFYVVRCASAHLGSVDQWQGHEGKIHVAQRPSTIYFADRNVA